MSDGAGGSSSGVECRSGMHADIFMTDLAPYVAAAQLSLLQNKSRPSPETCAVFYFCEVQNISHLQL
jgi:hypothetical protein